jgi:hypothetical protein
VKRSRRWRGEERMWKKRWADAEIGIYAQRTPDAERKTRNRRRKGGLRRDEMRAGKRVMRKGGLMGEMKGLRTADVWEGKRRGKMRWPPLTASSTTKRGTHIMTETA